MIMRIEQLIIENFKGCKQASFSFGDETDIKGKNATGKSTVADAFFWLLFNTDSHGNAPGSDKFREKPLDEDGAERHHLDTMVEARCTLDGQPFNLKRVQRENWPTRRGSKDAVYQGNSSTYWINDVETGAKDYAARINGIANGDLFALVAKLGAFNALDMKKKRTILLSMAGADVDDDLLAKEEYRSIAEEARTRGVSVDDLRKVLTDQKKRINQELTIIPAKIDEVNHMMPEYTEQEMNDAEYYVKETEADIEKCRQLIVDEQTGNGSAASAMNAYLDAEQELISVKRRINDDHAAARRRLEDDKRSANSKVTSAAQAQKAAANVAANAWVMQGDAQKALEDARNEYRAIFARAYTPPEKPSVCPTCGQPITDAHWAKSLEADRKAFEAKKKADQDAVSAKGKEYKGKYEEASKAAENAQKALEEADKALQEAQALLAQTSDLLSAFPLSPAYDDPQIPELEQRIAELKEKKDADPDVHIQALRKQIEDLTARNERAKATLSKRARKAECEQRIAELTEEQSKLGQKKADIENMIYAIERFVTERCRMLENSINDQFPTVRWKLFDQLINGSINDVCECLVPSDNALVSYSGTNTAAKVNADIEIIGVLSKHYDIIAPVFVDNAESVNYISKPEGQLITLSVTTDDELRVETKEAA